MSNQPILTPDELTHLSDKELSKHLKRVLKVMETKEQKSHDWSEWEHIYWLLQTERLKRLKGKNY